MKNIEIQSQEDATYECLLKNRQYKANIFADKVRQVSTYIDSGIPSSENKTFLEIGFNDGLLFKSLQKKYPKAKFIGVEVRQSCVDNMVKQGFDCRLITDEFFSIDEKFDVIYGTSVLHHISRPFDFITYLYNDLLKPSNGGEGDKIITFVNEAHRYDLVSILHTTLVRTWKYEKQLFKISKNKIKNALQALTNEYVIDSNPPVCITGFKSLDNIYRKMKLHHISFLGNLSFMIKKV